MTDRELILEIIADLKFNNVKVNLATVARELMDISFCDLKTAWEFIKPNKDLINS